LLVLRDKNLCHRPSDVGRRRQQATINAKPGNELRAKTKKKF